MASRRLPIQFPLYGVSKAGPASMQAPMTTDEGENARSIDPTTGRECGASRCGTTRISTAPVSGAGNPVRMLAYTVSQQPKVAYSGVRPDPTNDVVAFALGLRKPCYAMVIDEQSNAYVIDGLANLAKYNANGALRWSIAVPVADPAHLCRALVVDEFGVLYVGTSSGGDPEKGKLCAFVQLEDDGIELAWERDTGAFVEDMKLSASRLITLQNKPQTGESFVVGYDAITTTNPIEAFRSIASAGANGICVAPKGSFFVSAQAFGSNRGLDPRSPGGKITEDWKLSDLTDIDTRIAREFDPTSLLDEGYANGDPIPIWPDSSGSGADLFQKLPTSSFGAPTMIANSLGRLPAAYFAGSSVTPMPVLTTGPNYSTDAGQFDQQQTLLPAYQSSTGAAGYADNMQTVIVMLLRPERNLITAAKGMGFLKQNADGGRAHFLAFNTTSDNQSLNTATKAAGRVRYQFGTQTTSDLLNAASGGNAAVGQLSFSTSNPLNGPFDTETFTLNDGVSPTTTFEYDNTGAVTPGNVAITIGVTTAITKANTIAAINGVGGSLAITASDGGGNLITLTQDYAGTVGNTAIVEAVSNLNKTDFTGGTGTSGVISAGSWGETPSNAVLITLVLNHGTTGLTTDHPSQFRLNGNVIDEWDMRNRANSLSYLAGIAGATSPTEIGSIDFGSAANFDAFRGTVHYMAVLHRQASSTQSTPIRYPFTQNAGTVPAGVLDTSGDSELERIEGGIVNRFGCAHILPSAHPFSNLKGPPNKLGIAFESVPWLMNQDYPTLTKYSQAGEPIWCLTSRAAYRSAGPGSVAQTVSGIGYGAQCNSLGHIYTMGAHVTGTGWGDDYSQLRYILDNGDTPTFIAATSSSTGSSATKASASGAWSKTYNDITTLVGATNLDISAGYHYPRVGVDTKDCVFFPWSATTGAFIGVACVAYDRTGGIGASMPAPVSSSDGGALTGVNGLGLAFSQNGYVCAPDPNVPDYGLGPLVGTEDLAMPRAEHCWIATDLGTGGTVANPTVHKVQFVTSAPTSVPARTFTIVSVANGSVKVGLSPPTPPSGPNTLPGPQFVGTSDFFDWTVAFGVLYMTDGDRDLLYDPVRNEVRRWAPTKGFMRPRAKLLATYLGGVLRACFADDPHGYQISRLGDGLDYDTDPPVVSPLQAFDGATGDRTGRCPDAIRGLRVMGDDYCLFLCDHTVWRLSGHPMSGGAFDNVSHDLGAAFGRAHCVDEKGRPFFLSNKGSLCTIEAGRSVVPIANASLEREMRAVDFASYNIELSWNFQDEGIHVWQFPKGAGGPAVRHWFWELRENRFRPWVDTFGVTGQLVQPTCVTTFDGDAQADRAQMMGREDGHIVKWDRNAVTDDATAAGVLVPIDSKVLIGPIANGEAAQKLMLYLAEVELASAQGGAYLEVFGSDTADDKGVSRYNVKLRPGRSPALSVPLTAAYLWVRIRNGSAYSRWAFEQLALHVSAGGMKRVRS